MDQQSFNAPQSSPPKPKATIVWIVGLIVAIAAAGGGVYWWQQQRVDNLNTQLQAAQYQVATPAPAPAAAATLAQFHEEQIPYTFSYPADWTKAYNKPIHTNPDLTQTDYLISFMRPGTIVHEEPIGATTTAAGMRLQIHGLKTDLKTVEEDIASAPGIANRKDTTVAGVHAVEYTQGYESETTLYTAFIKDGMLYTVSFAAEDGQLQSKYLPDYRALVASLKF